MLFALRFPRRGNTTTNIHPLASPFATTTKDRTTMHVSSFIVAIAASAVTVNGAVVQLFASPNCQGASSYRNVYDNTCATGVMGFQSFKITSGGGGGQTVTTYSRDACVEPHYTCVGAGDVGTCHNSFGTNYSGSNAVSSGTACGLSK